MFSLIYLSLILFTMISKTIQLDDSCFNFNGTRNTRTNYCRVVNRSTLRYLVNFQAICMQCRMRFVINEIKPNCSKNFDCASLIFENNIMFETFFRIHRHALRDLFTTQLDPLPSSVLEIIVTFYNITKITNHYIDSIMDMNAPHMKIFFWFRNYSQDSTALTVENGSYLIRFKLLLITVQCDDNTSANYMVMGPLKLDGKLFRGNDCALLPHTKHVSFLKYD